MNTFVIIISVLTFLVGPGILPRMWYWWKGHHHYHTPTFPQKGERQVHIVTSKVTELNV